jgi:hypothetical protein
MLREDLTFDEELRRQTLLAYGGPWTGKIDDDVVRDAAQNHGLFLMDVLRDTLLRAIELSGELNNKQAGYFIRFGAARRLQMIWFAFRDVIFTVPADRDRPLKTGEARRLTRDLNTVYINIRGTLDNLCWSLLHTSAVDKTTLPPVQIDLFARRLIIEDQRFGAISDAIRHHSAWYEDLKTRRDPSAHRIPLYVPPQLVDPAEAAAYSELGAATWEAIGRKDFEAADRIMRDQEAIGQFVPWFLHDPEQAPIPIYPTVSEDLRHMVQIFRTVDGFLVEHGTSDPVL